MEVDAGEGGLDASSVEEDGVEAAVVGAAAGPDFLDDDGAAAGVEADSGALAGAVFLAASGALAGVVPALGDSAGASAAPRAATARM